MQWWLIDHRRPVYCRVCYARDEESMRWLWLGPYPELHVYVIRKVVVQSIAEATHWYERESLAYVMNGSPLCGRCRQLVSYTDYEKEESQWCATVKRHRLESEGTLDRKWLLGIPLRNITQNTSAWMRARFGPDLLRIGASRAGDVVGLSSYGDPLALWKMLRGTNDQLRWEVGGRSGPTEMGHAYEDFVTRLVEHCLPQYCIKDGDIRVPFEEKHRAKFAVSVDGYVYLKEEMDSEDERKGFQGGFEAKCSYHTSHESQAAKETYNPNREDGVKAVHIAQVHMQNWVVKAPWTIYCTVKWSKWIPPHPQLGIPPFESVKMVRIHTSSQYLESFLVPKLLQFADSLRDETCWKPSQPYPKTTPPKVKIEDLLISGSRAKAYLTRLSGELLFWRAQHERRAKMLGDTVQAIQLEQKLAGQEVDYSIWY